MRERKSGNGLHRKTAQKKGEVSHISLPNNIKRLGADLYLIKSLSHLVVYYLPVSVRRVGNDVYVERICITNWHELQRCFLEERAKVRLLFLTKTNLDLSAKEKKIKYKIFIVSLVDMCITLNFSRFLILDC